MQEAHKEYNSLTDQIWAKYEQLDKYGAVSTPAFNAETCELANLLACVSQLYQKLNLPPPKELYRPTFFKHWRHFLDQNSCTRQAVCLGYGGCSFVCRSVRITGLLSAPLVNLRIWDWLCVLPVITLVLTSPRKLIKLSPQTDCWWTTKPPRWKAFQIPFPLAGTRGPVYRVHFWPFWHE